VNVTGWSRVWKSLAGSGVVSHARPVLLRHISDKTGLNVGLVAGAAVTVVGHDWGRVSERPGVRDRLRRQGDQ
jgi:hypothetical protein